MLLVQTMNNYFDVKVVVNEDDGDGDVKHNKNTKKSFNVNNLTNQHCHHSRYRHGSLQQQQQPQPLVSPPSSSSSSSSSSLSSSSRPQPTSLKLLTSKAVLQKQRTTKNSQNNRASYSIDPIVVVVGQFLEINLIQCNALIYTPENNKIKIIFPYKLPNVLWMNIKRCHSNSFIEIIGVALGSNVLCYKLQHHVPINSFEQCSYVHYKLRYHREPPIQWYDKLLKSDCEYKCHSKKNSNRYSTFTIRRCRHKSTQRIAYVEYKFSFDPKQQQQQQHVESKILLLHWNEPNKIPIFDILYKYFANDVYIKDPLDNISDCHNNIDKTVGDDPTWYCLNSSNHYLTSSKHCTIDLNNTNAKYRFKHLNVQTEDYDYDVDDNVCFGQSTSSSSSISKQNKFLHKMKQQTTIPEIDEYFDPANVARRMAEEFIAMRDKKPLEVVKVECELQRQLDRKYVRQCYANNNYSFNNSKNRYSSLNHAKNMQPKIDESYNDDGDDDYNVDDNEKNMMENHYKTKVRYDNNNNNTSNLDNIDINQFMKQLIVSIDDESQCSNSGKSDGGI